MTILSLVHSIDKTAFKSNRTLKKVTITGTGAIPDKAFTYENWRGYAKGIFNEWGSPGLALVIANSITSIGKQAFQGNQLTQVILPEALYNKRGRSFSKNPSDLKFYEYNESQPDNKGQHLNDED